MYALHQAQENLLARLRPLALDAAYFLRAMDNGGPEALPLSQAAASLQLLESAGTTHCKPPFGLTRARIGDRLIEVREEALLATPFCTLRRFAKDVADPGPRVLVVAPLSGHYATRLRGPLEGLLPEHDVHVTDWTDASEVPLSAGPFGLDDVVAHLMACLAAMGPGAHVLAVSQAAVPALAAASLMAEDAKPARPRSMTLVAGPVDARVKNPTRDEILAERLSLAWIERAAVDTVPPGYAGAGRRVHSGAQQLTSSMLSDLPRHLAAHLAQFRNLLGGDAAAAEAHRRLYDELRAVMDVPAEVYLDTVHRVFQRHELAMGRMAWRGRAVRPEAIRDTTVLTVEADLSAPPDRGGAEPVFGAGARG